jgi:hypothetical protein
VTWRPCEVHNSSVSISATQRHYTAAASHKLDADPPHVTAPLT